MTNFRRQILLKMFMLLDPGLLTISYVAAAIRIWHLTEPTSFAAFFSMRIKLLNLVVFFGLTYSWHVIFSAFGLYGSRRLADRREEAVVVLKATSASALLLGFVAAFFQVRMITPAFITVFWIVATSAIIVSRLVLREFLRRARIRGRNLRHLLIIGTNPRAWSLRARWKAGRNWATNWSVSRTKHGLETGSLERTAGLLSATWNTSPVFCASASSTKWPSPSP